MSDTQYKSAYREGFGQSHDVDYRPEIPSGTIEMINKKFAEWEKRRGLAPERPRAVRGFAARAARKKAAEEAAAAKAAAKKSRAKTPKTSKAQKPSTNSSKKKSNVSAKKS